MSIRRGRARGCASPTVRLRLLLHVVLLHVILLHFVLFHRILRHLVLFHLVLFHRVLRHGVLMPSSFFMSSAKAGAMAKPAAIAVASTAENRVFFISCPPEE